MGIAADAEVTPRKDAERRGSGAGSSNGPVRSGVRAKDERSQGSTSPRRQETPARRCGDGCGAQDTGGIVPLLCCPGKQCLASSVAGSVFAWPDTERANRERGKEGRFRVRCDPFTKRGYARLELHMNVFRVMICQVGTPHPGLSAYRVKHDVTRHLAADVPLRIWPLLHLSTVRTRRLVHRTPGGLYRRQERAASLVAWAREKKKQNMGTSEGRKMVRCSHGADTNRVKRGRPGGVDIAAVESLEHPIQLHRCGNANSRTPSRLTRRQVAWMRYFSSFSCSVTGPHSNSALLGGLTGTGGCKRHSEIDTRYASSCACVAGCSVSDATKLSSRNPQNPGRSKCRQRASSFPSTPVMLRVTFWELHSPSSATD